MLADYRQFVGLNYEPPHGCLRLVEKIYREGYGIDLSGLDDHVPANDGSGLFNVLISFCDEIGSGEEKEGDIILLRSEPWHVGVVIGGSEMIHCTSQSDSTIENYNSIYYKNRVKGFYRYKEW